MNKRNTKCSRWNISHWILKVVEAKTLLDCFLEQQKIKEDQRWTKKNSNRVRATLSPRKIFRVSRSLMTNFNNIMTNNYKNWDIFYYFNNGLKILNVNLFQTELERKHSKIMRHSSTGILVRFDVEIIVQKNIINVMMIMITCFLTPIGQIIGEFNK